MSISPPGFKSLNLGASSQATDKAPAPLSQLTAHLKQRIDEIEALIAQASTPAEQAALQEKYTLWKRFNPLFLSALQKGGVEASAENQLIQLADSLQELSGIELRDGILRLIETYGLKKADLHLFPKHPKRRPSLYLVPLAALRAKGASSQAIEAFASRVNRFKRDFCEGSRAGKSLLQALIDIASKLDLAPAHTDALLERLSQSSSAQELYHGVRAVRQLIHLDQSRRLAPAAIKEAGGLEEAALSCFRKMLGITADEEACTRYRSQFLKRRNPSSLITYAALARQDSKVQACFLTWVHSVLDDCFYRCRYQVLASRHMTALHRLQPTLLAKLAILSSQSFAKSSVGTLTKMDSATVAEISRQSLRGLLHRELETLPLLQAFLNNQDISEKAKSLSCALIGKQEARKSVTVAADRQQIDQEIFTIKTQQCLIKACTRLRSDQVNKALRQALSFIQRLPGLEGLQLALEAYCQAEHSARAGINDYSVSVTDDYWDLFQSGSDQGSCQRVEGEFRKNKCLMGLVLDGYNFIIAVKSGSSEEIRGRRIVRVLIDEEAQQPALFVEDFYSRDKHPAIDDAVLEMATRIADYLQLRLYAMEALGGVPQPKLTLSCLGSAAPWAYSDAGGKVCRKGAFHIQAPKLLYEPLKSTSSK